MKNLGTEKHRPVLYILAPGVKALHPSSCRDTVTKALACALEWNYIFFNHKARKISVEFNRVFIDDPFKLSFGHD